MLKIKMILPWKTKPTKNLKRPRDGTGGGGKIVFTHRNCLRSWSAPFPRHPIMCLRVSHGIDSVIWVKNAIDVVFEFNRIIRDSSRA